MPPYLALFLENPALQREADFRKLLLVELAEQDDAESWLHQALAGGFSMAGEGLGWEGNALDRLLGMRNWQDRFDTETHRRLGRACLALMDAGCPVESSKAERFLSESLCFLVETEGVCDLAQALARHLPMQVNGRETDYTPLFIHVLRAGSFGVPVALSMAGLHFPPDASHEIIMALGTGLTMKSGVGRKISERILDFMIDHLEKAGLDLVRVEDKEGGIGFLLGQTLLGPGDSPLKAQALSSFERFLCLARGRQLDALFPQRSNAIPGKRL